jgi:hypothetical protein
MGAREWLRMRVFFPFLVLFASYCVPPLYGLDNKRAWSVGLVGLMPRVNCNRYFGQGEVILIFPGVD